MNKTNVTKTLVVRELDPIVERQSKVMEVIEETVRYYKNKTKGTLVHNAAAAIV